MYAGKWIYQIIINIPSLFAGITLKTKTIQAATYVGGACGETEFNIVNTVQTSGGGRSRPQSCAHLLLVKDNSAP
jgi:hypothetical protein